MAAKTENRETAHIKSDHEYYNELVPVKLFKDNDKYKDDIFVAVNGVGMIVPRGKEVLIPAIRQCILDVNIEEKKMTVHLLEGLLD